MFVVVVPPEGLDLRESKNQKTVAARQKAKSTLSSTISFELTRLP